MMRAVSLYALRYEKHSSNDVGGLLNVLSRRGVSEHYKKVVSFITSLTVVLWNAHAHCIGTSVATPYIWVWLLSGFGPKVGRHLRVRSEMGIDV